MNKQTLHTGLKLFSAVLLLSLVCVFPALAQEAAAAPEPAPATGNELFSRYVLWTFIGLEFLVLLLFVGTVNKLIKALIETRWGNTSPEAAAQLAAIVRRPSAWKKLMQRLTAAKPIEKEQDILLDHDYDGIRELDNHLPPWWKWGFYFCIFWSVVYIVNYHVAPIWNEGHSQLAEYEAENAKAELALAEYRKKAADQVDETNVILLTDAASLDKGKAKFTEVCAACHGDLGQGGIGPNLTDAYWLHGGDIKSVFNTIKYGVLDKGMIAWKDEIKPAEMQAVASYILSLQGSNPPGGKEPQGELYVPAADSTGTDSTAQPVVIPNATARL